MDFGFCVGIYISVADDSMMRARTTAPSPRICGALRPDTRRGLEARITTAIADAYQCRDIEESALGTQAIG
jgi:hypothetical protein